MSVLKSLSKISTFLCFLSYTVFVILNRILTNCLNIKYLWSVLSNGVRFLEFSLLNSEIVIQYLKNNKNQDINQRNSSKNCIFYLHSAHWLIVRMFANDPGDLGSIPGWVIPKTLKIVLDTSLLNNVRYVSRVKWSNPGKGVAYSPTPWCSSYWKGSLLVALDYGRQLYFT